MFVSCVGQAKCLLTQTRQSAEDVVTSLEETNAMQRSLWVEPIKERIDCRESSDCCFGVPKLTPHAKGALSPS